MGRDRVVYPGTTRIPLSDGDWIDVKKGLNAGEQRMQDGLAVRPVKVDGEVHDRIDWTLYEFMRADLWITDWSLTTVVNGKSISLPKTLDALRNLEPEDFDEINIAVYKHIKEWLAAKKAQRTLRAGTVTAKSTTASNDDPTSM